MNVPFFPFSCLKKKGVSPRHPLPRPVSAPERSCTDKALLCAPTSQHRRCYSLAETTTSLSSHTKEELQSRSEKNLVTPRKGSWEDSSSEDLLPAAMRVPRTGWVYRNVKQPESVSDHMYRMSMMALTLKDPSVNRERCIKMALVHDLAECIVGDIAPADNISKAEKHRREKEAMIRITGLLDEDLRKEEYESQSSHEAKLVKELDQLEMILQAHEYEELEGKPGRLQEFFTSTEGCFHHPEVQAFVNSLNKERADHMTKAGETESAKTAQLNSRTTVKDSS
ncbi:HD domain-containing protein 2 [Bagarius yarrelli]|uniref:5'-deoxynucleotidase HDDC2 n=1 Tax=Bagarius yarrelli TaxID=175774 RepID=A0A556UYD2_BAGYA|nr:HD domain-containing protein 2 [Bagarius yarrelli]